VSGFSEYNLGGKAKPPVSGSRPAVLLTFRGFRSPEGWL